VLILADYSFIHTVIRCSQLVLNLAFVPLCPILDPLVDLKIKLLHSWGNVNIWASTSVPFSPTAVQVPNLARIRVQREVQNKENLTMQKRELKLFSWIVSGRVFRVWRKFPTSNNKQLFKEFIHFLCISWWWWKPWLCCSLWFLTAILFVDSTKYTLVLKPATENVYTFLPCHLSPFISAYLWLYTLSP